MEYLRENLYESLVNLCSLSIEKDTFESNIYTYLETTKKFTSELVNLSDKLDALKNYEWLNVDKTIEIKRDLKGKIVLLDFWTYCCINCMHVIPLLKNLESEYHDLIVIGIHSSKFTNEKSKLNILKACKRHLIKHPVVCDTNLDLWSALEIACWPTFLVLNPSGLIIAEFKGELQANYLKKFLNICFKFYSNQLNKNKLEILGINFDLNIKNENLNCLNFPTKLFYDKHEELLFISDSGNNRILVVEINSNKIKCIIGNGNQGDLDGDFEACEFDWPQGLFYDFEARILYIADTFNNLIRTSDLNTLKTRKLCGVPKKMAKSIGEYDYKGGKLGLEQSISSPWDLCLFKKENSKVLLISCAGTHQIWLYSFENKNFNQKIELNYLNWWKGLKIEWNVLICIAGNGKERNKNNSYPLQASFAQPSGLGLDEENKILYISDSESSSIRILNLENGSVKGLVGGDFQPDNLFAYGDIDGLLDQAKLQHPLDCKMFNKDFLLIIDSYNNSLKKLNLKTKTIEKFTSDLRLNEPNGICILSDNLILIADTNNNSIKSIRNFNIQNNLINLEELKIYDFMNSKSNIMINGSNLIKVKFNFELNKQADNSWRVKLLNKNGLYSDLNGLFDQEEEEEEDYLYKINLEQDLNDIESIELQVDVIYCCLDQCNIFKNKFIYTEIDNIKNQIIYINI